MRVKSNLYSKPGTDDSSFKHYPIAISILDNGTGIEPELINKIFLPGVTARPDGHGLGLPISRMIAGLLGGAIEINGRGELGGAEVILRLPLESPPLDDIEKELEAMI